MRYLSRPEPGPSPAQARKGLKEQPDGFLVAVVVAQCRRIGSRWPGRREGDEAPEAATAEEEDGGGEGKGVPEETIERLRKKIYEYLLAHVEKIYDWLDTIGRRREGDEATEAATTEEEDGGGEGKGVPEEMIECLRKKIYEYLLAHVEKIYDWAAEGRGRGDGGDGGGDGSAGGRKCRKAARGPQRSSRSSIFASIPWTKKNKMDRDCKKTNESKP